jgi:hypothetical protein
VDEHRAFETEDGEACIIVRNGEGAEHRVSAADLAIDGEAIAGESDFNQRTDELSARRVLAAGAHELTARLRSTPGSFVEVTVLVAEPLRAEIVTREQALANLQHAWCLETRLGLSQLSPEELARAREAAVVFGQPLGSMALLRNRWGAPSVMLPLPLWDGATTNPSEAVSGWLDAHAVALGIEHPDISLEILGAYPDIEAGNTTVVVQERWRGLLVEGAGTEVTVQDSTGRPLAFWGGFVPASALPPDIAPAVDESAATLLAQGALADRIASSATASAELVVHANPEPTYGWARLAWRVRLVEGDARAAAAWIDAASGETLDRSRVDAHSHGFGAITYRTESVVCRDDGDEEFAGGTITYDVHDGIVFDGDCGGDATCEDIVQWTDETDERLITMLRVGGWSGNGAPGYTPSMPYETIYNLRGGARRSLSRGWVYLPFGYEHRDVLAHEHGHGVHVAELAQAGDLYLLDSNPTALALSESIGDALALLVSRDVGGGPRAEPRGRLCRA